jgi:hypothetical protein
MVFKIMLLVGCRYIGFAEFNRAMDQTGTEIRLASTGLSTTYESAHDIKVVASSSATVQTLQMAVLLATSVLSNIG